MRLLPTCRHARVYEEDGGFYIEDLKSTHGTLVAGQRLVPAEPMRLFDGLRVALASSGYEVVPTNTMAAVLAAMKSAQAEVARKEKEKQEAEVRCPASLSRPPPVTPAWPCGCPAMRAWQANPHAILLSTSGRRRQRRPEAARRRCRRRWRRRQCGRGGGVHDGCGRG